MDRQLDSAERRRALLRRAASVVGIAITVIAVFAALPSFLTPRVERRSLRIGRVDRGEVRVVVEASGVVEPSAERVITSPVESRLLAVLKRAGDAVAVGDRLVEIDDAAARAEAARFDDRLATLDLDRQQAALAVEHDLADLRQRASSRRLERDVAQAKVARWERLRADGLISEDQLDELRLEARRADLDVTGLDGSLRTAERSGAARIAALDLALQQARRERDEQARLLELAVARAESAGVVTWVLDDVGMAIPRGAPLARVASLDAYRVAARVSDVQAPRLAAGLPVTVRAPGVEIAGTIAAVSPAVEGGVLSFEVALDEPSHPALRPQLRVDAWVTVDRHDDVLRVDRPSGASPRSRARLFVVDGNRARECAVTLGAAAPDRIEIVDGLSEGEEVIVSDTSTWAGASALRIGD